MLKVIRGLPTPSARSTGHRPIQAATITHRPVGRQMFGSTACLASEADPRHRGMTMAPSTKAELAAEVAKLKAALKRERAKTARLGGALAEAREHQAATSEILQGISRSPADTEAVFDAIVRSAARLCDAEFSAVARFGGGLLYLAAISNMSPRETKAYQSLFPRPPLRNFVIGRAFLNGEAGHVEDVTVDPDYDPRTLEVLQSAACYRTYLGIPILQNGVPIGEIGCGRRKVKPFTPEQIELVKTFAAEAVIAIGNASLVTALDAR